jgi:hypothetical protein
MVRVRGLFFLTLLVLAITAISSLLAPLWLISSARSKIARRLHAA